MLKEKNIYLPVGILTIIAVGAGAVLTVASSSAVTKTANAKVMVASSCTMSYADGDDQHSTSSIGNGQSGTIDGITLTANCNDGGGYDIYAVGHNGTAVSTTLSGTSGSIATGTSSTGGASYWGFYIETTGSASIKGGYGSLSAVPSSYAKIAEYSPTTVASTMPTGTVSAKYFVSISNSQPAGTYTGGVRYMIVHPYNAAAPTV